jgi:hypothetical protein
VKLLRRIHLFLGCFFAPLLLFYLATGWYQTMNVNRNKNLAEAETWVSPQRSDLPLGSSLGLFDHVLPLPGGGDVDRFDRDPFARHRSGFPISAPALAGLAFVGIGHPRASAGSLVGTKALTGCSF